MYRDIIIEGGSRKEALQKLTEGPVGYSVARAARILDMNRQGIDKAVRRGALHATRFYLATDKGLKLISTEVDRESVHDLAAAKEGRDRAPRGYQDNQIRLFG